jgi:uncharacterized phiE125 gp8 family phage protein
LEGLQMRWLDPQVTVAPAADVVTLAEAKAHLRVEAEDTDNDAAIRGYVSAAVSYAEQYTGLRLAPQTVKLRAWALDACTFRLPTAPIESITSITYLDQDGAEQALDASAYVTDLNGIHPTLSRAYHQTWPAHRVTLGSITITAVCGYAAGQVPTPIKQAILLMVGDWFSNRETTDPSRVQAIEMVAVDALLANYRRAYV